MSRCVAPAFTLGLVAACHATSSIDPPELTSPSGLLFYGGAADPAFAFNQGDDVVGSLPSISDRGDLAARIFDLPCTLRVSGIEAGPLELREAPVEGTLHPLGMRVLTMEDGATRWVERELLAEDEALVARVKVDPAARCRETSHVLEFEPVERYEAFDAFAVAVAPHRVVVGLTDEAELSWQLGWIGPNDESLMEIDAPDGPWAAAIGWEDEVWVARKDGALAHGRLGEPFELVDVRTSTPSKFALGLTASTPPAAFEIFAVTDAGTVERFDGTEWDVVYAIEPGLRLLRDQSFAAGMTPGIAWVGPSDVMAIVPGPDLSSQIVRAENGSARIVPFPGRPYGVGTIDGVGTFASGASQAEGMVVARLEGEEWVRITGLGLGGFNERHQRLLAFDRFYRLGDGYLFGRLAFYGSIYAEYDEQFGYCQAEPALTPFLKAFAPLDEASFVTVYKLEAFGTEVEVSRIHTKFRGACGEVVAR
ncbi:MAG: hypothetical protein HYV07_17670 [Deltaproteobacteria bacterium]|nr:hypothetical protein [Deltaproteobacteria bacterium]